MEWLQNNWIWIALGGAFIAIHMFGHGGHGGHNKRDPNSTDDATGAPGARPPERTASKVTGLNDPVPADVIDIPGTERTDVIGFGARQPNGQSSV